MPKKPKAKDQRTSQPRLDANLVVQVYEGALELLRDFVAVLEAVETRISRMNTTVRV